MEINYTAIFIINIVHSKSNIKLNKLLACMFNTYLYVCLYSKLRMQIQIIIMSISWSNTYVNITWHMHAVQNEISSFLSIWETESLRKQNRINRVRGKKNSFWRYASKMLIIFFRIGWWWCCVNISVYRSVVQYLLHIYFNNFNINM